MAMSSREPEKYKSGGQEPPNIFPKYKSVVVLDALGFAVENGYFSNNTLLEYRYAESLLKTTAINLQLLLLIVKISGASKLT